MHKDQSPHNIRLIEPIEVKRPSFVIFDFGWAQLAREWSTEKEHWGPDKGQEDHWLRMDRYRVKLMLRQFGKQFEESDWFASDRGRELVELWNIHPEELSEEQREPAWYSPEMDSSLTVM